MTWKRHLPVALACITAPALVLAPAPRGPTAAAGGTPDLRPFYAQRIHWTDCGKDAADSAAQEESPDAGPTDAAVLGRMQCGEITVPFDYAVPSRGTLRIALTRFPATGPGRRLGSLPVNFGGPGISGVNTLAEHADSDLAALNVRYDLIGFDQRGVGQSLPVTCGDPHSLGTGDGVTVLQQLARDCQKHSGRILPWVGTTNASRDLDVLRQALGDPKLDYLGFSYGTKLGAVYAHQFPGKAGRLALDAVEDPTADTRQMALGQAAAFQHTLQDFVDDCARQGADCPFGSRDRGGMMDEIDRFARQLEGRPLPTPAGDLDQATYLTALQESMYSKDAWPVLREALAALKRGDGSWLVRLGQGAGTGIARDAFSPGNYEEAQLAIDCRDTADRYTIAQVRAAEPDFLRASPIFGQGIASSLLSCSGWPVAGDNTSRDVKAPGAPPALLVSTTGDPATPYANARKMADTLGNGSRELTFDGEGHGAYFSGSRCVSDKVNAYLLQGRLPAPGTRCG